MTRYSKVKEVSFSLLGIIDDLVRPEIKNSWALRLWDWFALKRAKQIIINKPNNELQLKMKQSFDLMKPVCDKVEMAYEIKDSRSLNSRKMQNFVEQNIGKEVLDLIP